MNKKYITKELIIRVFLLMLMGILIQIGGMYALNAITGMLPLSEGITESYSKAYNALTSMNPGMVIYVCLVAPFIEEGVFRYLILRLGKKYLRFWIINIIQALAFGIYHGNIIQGSYSFVLGILLGAVCQYMGGYLAVAFVHVVINSTGLAVMGKIRVSDNCTPAVQLIIGLALLAVATLIVLVYYKKDILSI